MKRKRSVMISKKREESGMVGHARIDGRMAEKISKYLMVGLTVKEAGEEGKDLLIIRLSKDEH